MTVCLLNYPTLYRHFTGSVAVMSRGGDWPQIVRCKDGWIGLCIFTPQQWDDFANMIGRPELTGDVVVVAHLDFVQAAAAVDQAGFLERGLGGLPSRNLPSPHEFGRAELT